MSLTVAGALFTITRSNVTSRVVKTAHFFKPVNRAKKDRSNG